MLQKVLTYLIKPDIWLGTFSSFALPFGVSRVFQWLQTGNGRNLHRFGFDQKKKTKKSFMEQEVSQPAVPFTADLNQNLLVMKEIIGHNSDAVFSHFKTGPFKWKVAVVYIDGLVDKIALIEQVIKPLMQDQEILTQKNVTANALKNSIVDSIVCSAEVKEVPYMKYYLEMLHYLWRLLPLSLS